jgi:hypothetical protein
VGKGRVLVKWSRTGHVEGVGVSEVGKEKGGGARERGCHRQEVKWSGSEQSRFSTISWRALISTG